jgi:hypothetical protein
MHFPATGDRDGKLTLSAYTKEKLRIFLAENGPIRMTITADLPESDSLRRWYEGALVPLVCFYQEGMDHRNSADRANVREWLKTEFNGDIVVIQGKAQRIARSTKGRAVLGPFIERVKDWLEENYAPPAEALDAKEWKTWRNTIYPTPGTPDTYIDYLAERGILRAKTSL